MSTQMFVGVGFNYAGKLQSPLDGSKWQMHLFICIFGFRFLSQSCFIYINPKVSLFTALLGFDNGHKIMNCITEGHVEPRICDGFFRGQGREAITLMYFSSKSVEN